VQKKAGGNCGARARFKAPLDRSLQRLATQGGYLLRLLAWTLAGWDKRRQGHPRTCLTPARCRRASEATRTIEGDETIRFNGASI